MRHEIHIGRNSLATDLSEEMGGEGSGPSPHDLYDAALGACKALTVLLTRSAKIFWWKASRFLWSATRTRNARDSIA
jgi:uncharacterized OsmC-like protein